MLASSFHCSPLDICSSWRSVIAWRGSPAGHSGRGGCSSRLSTPSPMSRPTIADVKLLATEYEPIT